MKQNNRMLLGAMLTAMLLINIAFVPAVSAKGANENKGVNNVGDIKYTPLSYAIYTQNII